MLYYFTRKLYVMYKYIGIVEFKKDIELNCFLRDTYNRLTEYKWIYELVRQ